MSYLTTTSTTHFMGWALNQEDLGYYLGWFLEDPSRTTADWVKAQINRYTEALSNPRTPQATFWGLGLDDERSAEEKAIRIREVTSAISTGLVEAEFRAFFALSSGSQPLPIALTVINILDRK